MICELQKSRKERVFMDIAGGNLQATNEFVGLLRRHIDKEDNGLFPAAAIALDGEEWEQVDELTHPRKPLMQRHTPGPHGSGPST